MGGTEKAFLAVGGVPMLTRVVQSLAPQCACLLLSAAGDLGRFAFHGLTVIPDEVSRGPMAALADVLDRVASADFSVTHVLSVPSDTPFLPNDLCTRLAAALEPNTLVACAASGGRVHPVIGLWPLEARRTLQEAAANGMLSFHAALAGKKVAKVDWGIRPRDPFFNVNTAEDLVLAEKMLRQD